MIIPHEHSHLYPLLKFLSTLKVAKIKSAFGAYKQYGVHTNKAYLMGELPEMEKPYANCMVVIFE